MSFQKGATDHHLTKQSALVDRIKTSMRHVPAWPGLEGTSRQHGEEPSREKALLKRQQDALDELAHLMEDCNDRLTLKALNVGERYTEGRLRACLKLRSRNSGEEFILIAGTRSAL